MSTVLWWPLGERSVTSRVCPGFAINDEDTQDAKVRLFTWDGKLLKEGGLLEGNVDQVTAVRFSPDGAMVVSGDVSRAKNLQLSEFDPI